MRSKSMVLIIIALGCGLVASIGISQVVKEDKSKPSVETQKIFVAMSAIDIGERLDAQNVRLEAWPKDRVPEGAISKLEDLKDRYPRQRLYAGEPILRAKLMDSLESDAMKIPEGYRVVSVKVTIDSAVSGLVRPGDRVDVLVFLRKNGEIDQTGVRTILRDVRVFAVNHETERSVDTEGKAMTAKTVSLLVEPPQVERLMLAGQLGNLQLSLRRPDDRAEVTTAGTTVDQLFGQIASRLSSGVSANTNSGEEKPGFVDWLKQQAQKPEEKKEEPIQSESVADVWKMVIRTPEGRVQYRWTDPSSEPEQVSFTAEHKPASATPAVQPTAAAAPETPTASSDDSSTDL